MKMDKKDACAVAYFGDGGTSEVLNTMKKSLECTEHCEKLLFGMLVDIFYIGVCSSSYLMLCASSPFSFSYHSLEFTLLDH